jgi:hypothetical protein
MRTLWMSFVVSSLAWADTSAPPPPKAKGQLVATMERTACYGTCPMYKIRVWSDGLVEWEGGGFVKQIGKATATLTPAELEALRKAFTEAKYLALEGDFGCYEATDNPSADTSFSDGKRQKSIHHYYGCRTPPQTASLTALERRFDEIVKSERWVGTEKERDELRKRGRLQ